MQSTLPTASMVLICFNQAHCIRDALLGALAQDYGNLEICISDDASTDSTWDVIAETLRDYAGPHRIRVERNPINLGIGANIDQTVRRSTGELIFVTAGDDVSLPNRVSSVMSFWVQDDRNADLIACHLQEMSLEGNVRRELHVSDLGTYRSLADWINRPPHVIGAAQAWTRRLFDRFGGLPKGVVGEDMVMAFRAVAIGRAVTYPHALVRYRMGGITNQGRVFSANQVRHGLTRKLKSTKIELSTMLFDAQSVGASQSVIRWLEQRLHKEEFIEAMFANVGFPSTWRAWWGATDQPWTFRIRIWFYAKAPWMLAPFFMLKRLRYCR